MIYKILEQWDRLVSFKRVRAHCDIPCGIYDPITAQISALTVIRMMDLMKDFSKGRKERDVEFENTMARYIAVKEEHAEKCKREIRVIWGDYFKPEIKKQYPELDTLVHEILAWGSRSRQTADREAAMGLLQTVNRFAEVFWKSKGIGTRRAKAPYEPHEEVVYPVL